MGPNPIVQALTLYTEKSGRFEILKHSGEAYSALALTSHPSVWIKEDDLKPVRRMTEGLALQAASDPASKTPVNERMLALRSTALLVVEDLFDHPTTENIQRSVKVVGSFVHVLMKDPNAYLYLAKLSSHDPYTLQHSVGAAVNSIILGRKMGLRDERELEEVGLGGLLHDVGKVKVKKEIINKEGPLDEIEWEEMRQHSQEGYAIVKDHANLTERTKRAVLEHHEDKTGTGYPRGLKEGEIDLFAKIVCISDIFNALTTNRSYSKARTPFEAFQLMREKMQHKLDADLFKNLVMIYGGKID